MKKILTLAAAITVAASMAYAASNEVYSVNIVGFQKMDLPSNFKIISVPFDVEGSLCDALGTNGNMGAEFDFADQIFIFNGSTYDKYFLYDGSYSAFFPDTPAGWCDMSYNPATNVVLYPGMSFWYNNGAANTETNVIVGDVVMDAVATNVISAGFTLISSPFSCDMILSDMQLTNGTSGAEFDFADQIFIFNGSTYDKYFLYDGSYSAFFPDTPAGWCDMSYNAATNVTIEAGEGFWYNAKTGYTWLADRPYDVD